MSYFVTGSLSQVKQAINALKQHNITSINTYFSEYSLNSQNKIKYTHNGSFFSYKKQYFDRFIQSTSTTRYREDRQQCSAKSQMTFSCQMGKTPD